VLEIRQTRAGKTLFPEYGKGLPEHIVACELLGSSHSSNPPIFN
jgi:hypothetical protein